MLPPEVSCRSVAGFFPFGCSMVHPGVKVWDFLGGDGFVIGSFFKFGPYEVSLLLLGLLAGVVP